MKRLFLTGASGIGKSTILMHAVSDLIASGSSSPNGKPLKAGGLFTQRLLLADGSVGGFRLLSWQPGLPLFETMQPGFTDLFIRRTESGWENDSEVFSGRGVSLLKEASFSCDILCLDEIGGAELLIPDFYRQLIHLLQTSPCCIGVIKGEENLSAMIGRLSLNDLQQRNLVSSYRSLTQHTQDNTLYVTVENREQVSEKVRSFLQ